MSERRVTTEEGDCGGCGQLVIDPDYCWFCQALLCDNCWETIGHCGHPEADAINVASMFADDETRSALIRPFSCFEK